jgi:hypothetical protein
MAKIVYQTNAAGVFVGAAEADESPLEPGVYLLPAGCIEVKPPATAGNDYAVWNGVEWQVKTPPIPDRVIPPTLPDLKVTLSAQVDDVISAIYSRFTRFTSEYELREAAARAFKAANYAGTPDPWVTSFATPAGLTPAQATDLIISQADTLRTALATLGALRMRKYEIASAADAITAQAIHGDIVLKATVAAEGL